MTEQVQLPESLSNALAPLVDNPAYSATVPLFTEKLGSHYALVQQNNRNVARVQESKNTDPNNTDYQDATWARVVAENADPKMVAAEKKYQKLIEQSELLLAELREGAKAHMQPALSEEEIQKLRKTVNDGKSVIADSAKATTAIAEMADQMLTLAGAPVEGGIWSLMPQPDSLMNARGRKSSGSKSEGGTNFTRVIDIQVDGEAANKTVKGRDGSETVKAHFNFAAERLSRKFNASQFPENEVTAEELEQAYYASNNTAFRDSGSMPTIHEFAFSKTVKVQNPNDDSTTDVLQMVTVNVTKWTRETAGLETNEENAEKSEK